SYKSMKHEFGTVIGFGAASIDMYRPVGEVSTGHEPGASAEWRFEDEQELKRMETEGCDVQLGGNVVNVMVYLAQREGFDVHYAGVIGEKDLASYIIYWQMFAAKINTDRSLVIPDYNSALSIQERLPNSPAMSRDRPGDPIAPYMNAEFIRKNSEDADTVIVGSFYGDAPVADVVFNNIPSEAFMTYVPGSEEYKQYPDLLQALMSGRQPTLLSLNRSELRYLYEDSESTTEHLTVRAGELAEYVLCTLGEEGALLAHNGDVVYGEAEYVDPKLIVDTTGAGDRAAAVTTEGLLQGISPETILANIARNTAQVIQHRGCTTDLID
ncbi:MAG TPA: carbohydrate kinase family protein, partial [Candidatus Limnocylindrales bacterium]|nr:carbohydrate kinase family protein [Candidatus Limnocylindrales bacterium]